MDRRTADATEQWLHSLLQSLDATPVVALPASLPPATITTANTLQRKSATADSTHVIRVGADRRLVTITFAVNDATAPVPKPQKEQQVEWPGWVRIPVIVLGAILGR